MTTTLTEDTRSLADVAYELGISHHTLWRWATYWGHPQAGTGTAIRLEPWEIHIARAWTHLTIHGPHHAHRIRTYRQIVADQIRAHPTVRYLLLTSAHTANTFDTREQATRWWIAHGQTLGVARIFDLEAAP